MCSMFIVHYIFAKLSVSGRSKSEPEIGKAMYLSLGNASVEITSALFPGLSLTVQFSGLQMIKPSGWLRLEEYRL